MMMMMIFSLSGFNTLIEKTLFTFKQKWCQAQIRVHRRSVDHLNKIKNPQIRKKILQVAKQSLGQFRWRSNSELPYEQNSRMKLKRKPFCCCCYGAWAQKELAKLQNSRAYTEKNVLSSMKLVWLIQIEGWSANQRNLKMSAVSLPLSRLI